MCLSVAYHFVNESLHGNEIGDSSGDYGRRGFRSQETRRSFFHNRGEIVDGYGRCVYRYYTTPFPYHNPGEFGLNH